MSSFPHIYCLLEGKSVVIVSIDCRLRAIMRDHARYGAMEAVLP